MIGAALTVVLKKEKEDETLFVQQLQVSIPQFQACFYMSMKQKMNKFPSKEWLRMPFSCLNLLAERYFWNLHASSKALATDSLFKNAMQ